MARVISPRLLASSPATYTLSPFTHIGSSLFPSKNPAIPAKSIWKALPPYSVNTRPGTPLMATASSAGVSDNIAEVLGEVGILTASGEPVKFKDLWDQQEGIAVVALLRHFGCFCCWELASALKESKERFDSAGVKLIAVGVGTPDKARLLAERLPFPMDILYADPDRKTKVFSRIGEVKKAMKNYTIKATPDDRSSVLQQGGMFVFKGKRLLYARKDEGTGDHASLDQVFDVCCKATAA
ncbi:thioredoxin-like protein AAED1, chloroplastic isoform X2 [Primulina huaijiensis]|uniref:thioredoxin-like protein AAED1, chloroplastic isoform X2 n=1 Tax=Primulina huaijiensis TaxID=1492673 RepID=UPI003CC6DEA4